MQRRNGVWLVEATTIAWSAEDWQDNCYARSARSWLRCSISRAPSGGCNGLPVDEETPQVRERRHGKGQLRYKLASEDAMSSSPINPDDFGVPAVEAQLHRPAEIRLNTWLRLGIDCMALRSKENSPRRRTSAAQLIGARGPGPVAGRKYVANHDDSQLVCTERSLLYSSLGARHGRVGPESQEYSTLFLWLRFTLAILLDLTS